MRITLIHGQDHQGSTYHIARMIAEKIGGEIDEFFLPRDFSDVCTGCNACLYKGREYCPHADNVSKIFDSMLSADVMIIGSPTYVMEMTSSLKGFFEHIYTAWLPHRPEEAMFSKIAIVISTAAGMGMTGVTKSIAKQMFYLGVAKTYRLPFRVLAGSWDGEEDGVPEKIKAKIFVEIEKIARKISLTKRKAVPGIKTKIMFSAIRSFQKNNKQVSLDKTYWLEKGWLGKGRPWKPNRST